MAGGAVQEVSFGGLLVVVAVAFLVPLLLGAFPRLRLPPVALEIAVGVLIGLSVFGLVEPDAAIEVLSLLGLAFLLFLADMELDLELLGGRTLGLAIGSFLLSLALALPAGLALGAVGLIEAPLFVAIVLSATAVGLVVPVLKNLGETSSPFGQLVIAAASVAEFATIVLLSLLLSEEATSAMTRVALLAVFALLVVMAGFALLRAERWQTLSLEFVRLQDTTEQLRVRGAFLLLVAFAALAGWLGFEVILGAFAAGALVGFLDRGTAARVANTGPLSDHPQFRIKLEAAGYGMFIPVFFVASGVGLDLGALFGSPATLAAVPVLLGALLIVRGVPAIIYAPLIGDRRAMAAALLQATTLSFVVAAAQIGEDLGLLGPDVAAALITAGLLSVLLFPFAANTVLRGAGAERGSDGLGKTAHDIRGSEGRG